ncbi:hypothetical protein D3C72_1799200 [compost metagenome]
MLHGAAQHADVLALVPGVVDLGAFLGQQAAWHVEVHVAEIDDLGAFRGDAHRGDGDFKLLGLQRRHDAVEVHRFQFALQLGLGTDGAGDVRVEAGDAAVGGLFRERRVADIGDDADGLGLCQQWQRADGGQRQQVFVVHVVSVFLCRCGVCRTPRLFLS